MKSTRITLLAIAAAILLSACGGGAPTTATPGAGGGTSQTASYAGPAPAFVGLSQINIQVPQAKSGAQPVQVLIGTAPFPQNVQLWVQ